MKNLFLIIFTLVVTQSGFAQLDTIHPTKLIVGISLGQLVSFRTPAAVVYANQKVGKNQYVDGSFGIILNNAATLNAQVEKFNGQRYSLSYRYQKERNIFNNRSTYVGFAVDIDHFVGEGRTTYTRAGGQFFQRYPFKSKATNYFFNVDFGLIVFPARNLTFEFGGKLGRGISNSTIESNTPNDATPNDPDAFNVNPQSFFANDEGTFMDFRVMIRIGYVISVED